MSWKEGDVGRLTRDNIGGPHYGEKGQLFVVTTIFKYDDETEPYAIHGTLINPKSYQSHYWNGDPTLSFWLSSEKL